MIMNKKYLLVVLSCGVSCCASENNKQKKYDVLAMMLENDENKIHENFARVIASKDKQDVKFGSEQPDLTATCILNLEDKIYQSLKGVISSQEIKDRKNNEQQNNQRRFGRGSLPETQGVDLQHGGKYIAVKKSDTLSQRRFGRGSSGKGESRAKL